MQKIPITPPRDLQHEVDHLLLANYIPAGVVVDTDMTILQVRGHTGFYLELAAGKSGMNLLKMVRRGLGPGVRAALAEARKSQRQVRKEPVPVTAFGSTRQIRITVHPLQGPPAENYFLILFEELPLSALAAPPGRTGARGSTARQLAPLELELATTRAEMQHALEAYEASKEELQVANEEIRASNEELHTMNEELEVSQEELQATNQELLTTNQSLAARNEEVQIARDRAEAIVETVREPLVVLTPEGYVERANPAFYQVFQLLPQQTEGRLLFELDNGQWNMAQFRTLFEQVATTHQPLSDYKVDQHFPRLGHKILRLNVRPVVEGPTRARSHRILLAIEDITARTILERQKESLLGMASHELKTPITAAKLQVQLLQRQQLKQGDPSLAPKLTKIEAHLNRLTRLVDGYLDVAAIETGNLSVHREAFAIDELIQAICEELQPFAPDQPLAFVQQAHTQVEADRGHIEEVLSNLLTNAIKYAPSRQAIEVRAYSQGNWVTVSVRDHGKGIPQAQQATIFERFYRGHDPDQRQRPGTGLGLYLVAELVKHQGGRIWVESPPGEGATFCFTLPQPMAAR